MAVFRVDVGEAVVSDAPPLVPRHAIGGREEFTSVAGAVPGLVTASVRHQWSFAAAAHPSAPKARSEEPLADTRRLPSVVAESWAWQLRAACRNMDSEVSFTGEARCDRIDGGHRGRWHSGRPGPSQRTVWGEDRTGLGCGSC